MTSRNDKPRANLRSAVEAFLRLLCREQFGELFMLQLATGEAYSYLDYLVERGEIGPDWAQTAAVGLQAARDKATTACRIAPNRIN
ncbi:hypothetical protein ACIPRI_21565 [Variovorax sp. LARHSF232]